MLDDGFFATVPPVGAPTLRPLPARVCAAIIVASSAICYGLCYALALSLERLFGTL
jgi:hypothetical protein